jgi:hypothetical protein
MYSWFGSIVWTAALGNDLRVGKEGGADMRWGLDYRKEKRWLEKES